MTGNQRARSINNSLSDSSSGDSEMPTFRNQMQAKCKLVFAEQANQLWSLGAFKVPRVEVQSPCPVRSCCLNSS